MQVIEKTSSRLVLRARPGLLLLLIGGPCLVLALIAFAKLAQGATEEAGKAALVAALMAPAFAVFVRWEETIFDRASGDVLITSRGLLGRRGSRHPLDAIRSARMESDPDGDRSKSGKPLARPVLVNTEGRVLPLRWAYTVDPSDDAAVSAIRAWLAPQGGKKGRAAKR